MNETKIYKLADMQAVYVFDENSQVQLLLLPESITYKNESKERTAQDSLVQIKISGDAYPEGYSGGRTMRNGESVLRFKFDKQDIEETAEKTEIRTYLKDDRGFVLIHHLYCMSGDKNLWSYTEFINNGKEKAGLEMLSSFSIGKISPLLKSAEWGKLKLHRLRSVWSMEGRLTSSFLEDLQLEPSWTGHAVRCERFGQVGSMPVNGYFPYAVIEDTKNDIFWGVQLAHNASWQLEAYVKDFDIVLSGGLADREFGHWMKYISPGECFKTPEAVLSVCKGGGIDEISGRLTGALNRIVDKGPGCEQELPVMFNEYCTTWGCPSDENIRAIVDKIKNRGISYFVIDAGWYKQEGIPWHNIMGDYDVSKELFPDGLKNTVDYVNQNGMKAGIWFEIENVGKDAKMYKKTDYLLKRDGIPLATQSRRFFDLRQEKVQDYLSEKVIEMLKEYGFEYMKMDYNDTIGIGCDGADSLGEGLRQNMEASVNFIKKVKAEIPGIILENCSSGGHKLEPLMMSICSMASFSDAHECEEIPIIAANLHRAILPRQSQIWAAIRKTDTLKRVAYSVASGFLGRLCLSGDVHELSDEQWDIIDKGISFYKKIAPIIKNGKSRRFGPDVKSYRHPQGWQCIVREGQEDEAYAVFHTFNSCHDEPLIAEIPEGCKISGIYSDDKADVCIDGNRLICRIDEDMRAVAVYMTKE